MYQEFSKKGFSVVKNRSDMLACDNSKPILGVFYNDGLPYSKDRENSKELTGSIPNLAEITIRFIDKMKDKPNIFVLQVKSSKVHYVAHVNDITGLLYDQLARDKEVKITIDFAE
ncbi:Alkaline phosphatase [Flavobacterium fryxellicola]|uniref:Uncharacterized protein n=1 Tax=Flavobacterium fryxellicola TaxID=249352 RepID=A0A167WFU4_9FLAO|nr:alkaline phosphatase [Flavobacterium fryxellicola]OAB27337.1 hypothetical protein FBFR_12455 [Flavobacterium fryxellicola]SHN66656.1 Alkaline phosphatase [Flavobacterium fryxellicola]